MKKLLFCLLLLSATQLNAADSAVLLSWTDAVVDLTKNAVGYTPPVASRSYAYFGLTMWYAANADDSAVIQKLNEINFSQKTIFRCIKYDGNKAALTNAAAYYFVVNFFSNADSGALQRALFLKNKTAKAFTKKEIKKADSIGKEIAVLIYTASLRDGGHEGYLKNYPVGFLPPVCDSCWVRTPPSFFPSLQPYWGKNQMLLLYTFSAIDTIKPMAFSTDTLSKMYKENSALYKLYQNLSNEDIATARYWNDDPGYSGTPSGHILCIAKQIIARQQLPLEKATAIIAAVGVALNDVNILTWRLKYQYNLIRPITYIHRHIAKDFSPVIPTPPFPEFPSGHSCLSGAGITVLQNYFTGESKITDSTHIGRVDIDGSPRTYADFESMKKELSNSRWLGGIHFKNTLDKSVLIGNEIGRQTFVFFNR